MNDIYSFYQLISKYQIEIPIIQRDYAQGRNNSKAADVRKSFVDNMIKAVKEDKPLFFDFVYGRVDNNKFIPFDGQQRLTTLFLFHKYVFEKCQSGPDCNHKDNCSCRDILGRFSYATRQSSREFCDKLVQEKIISDNSLTDNIKNQSWFYPDWEKDPTIMGMLTMLDEIHCQMRNEIDFKTFAEKLTSGCNCPITFHFVDMGEHKLSDETYVKMNARGKTLTPFENFKASLEQYLEEKNEQELLSRLKGKYDESKQKYTGIDGSWLDLFWEVTNKEKQENEGKELPDSLMMSFFNRHFMNVWRCWYENNSKTEKERNSLNDEQKKEQDEQDEFNKRIQEEMPLYPTKDNFVSFDIYEYVIGKCGVDECLTPIFNILDALCEKNDSILSDCQTVWNRKEKGPKWNLYQGDKNKDNRETYPSRVAFYALMRYFTNSTDATSLTQWMRVVWNIIENSTIDSSDTYHAALRLIEKLSAKSHTIYNALANEFESFELGNQYHAQEQVAEEIAKAKQILDEDGNLRKYKGSCKKEDDSDYQTWEEIIIDAESYAFFKGSIRFLFTNGEGNINWDDFDTKWTNAQKYFDEGGVKDDKKVLLTKSLVIQCDNWIEQLYDIQIFNPNANTWKWILTAKNWIVPVHNILMANNIIDIGATNEKNDEKVKEFITPIIEDLPFDYFINNEPNGRFRWLGPRLCFYKPYGRDMATLDWENWHRNKILSSLLESNIITTDAQIGDSNLFWGWNIKFSYNKNYFQWYGNPNEKKLDVYLMENDWADYKKRLNPTSDKGTDEDNYYCFRVTEDMESNTSLFIEELDRLIDEASQNS